jgi:peptidoglycan/LPS O-acetylase OafA/YrhL
MTKIELLFNKLKRTTSGGNFIPEIDGLRFIAVISVVLFHIVNHYIDKCSFALTESIAATHFVQYFGNGVYLFFAISGFILALPFAKHYLISEPKPKLKAYFLRRLTRLEPPSIICR